MMISIHHTPQQPEQELLDWMKTNWVILPEEGIVISRQRNKPIGWPANGGYITLNMRDDRFVKRSHVIYWSYHGEWPDTIIDHWDRHPENDKIGNLVPQTHSGNMRNAEQTINRKLPVGLYFMKSNGGYKVERRINNKMVCLKWFPERFLENAIRLALIAEKMIPQGATKEQILERYNNDTCLC